MVDICAGMKYNLVKTSTKRYSMMKEKIEKVIEKIEASEKIDAEKKPLIIQKINEWKEEDDAISEVILKLENWWMEVEPYFAEMGLV